MKWYWTLAIVLVIIGLLLFTLFGMRDDKINWDRASNEFWNSQEQLKIHSRVPDKNRLSYPVLYINLARDARKRFFMERQFREYKIDFERVEAIDGTNIFRDKGKVGDIEYRNNFRLSKKEIACTLSHLKAIKYAYDKGMDNVVIMEDDISLTLLPFWKKSLPDLISGPEWNIVELHNRRNVYREHGDLIGSKKHGTLGSAVYILNRKGIENVMKKCFYKGIFYLDKEKIKSDGNADPFIYYCAEKSYTLNYPLFYTDKSATQSYMNPTNNVVGLQNANMIIHRYMDSLPSSVTSPKPERKRRFEPPKDYPVLYNIDKVLYINLDHRTDRKNEIETEFKRLGISLDRLERISAIAVKKNGAIGCLQSHIKALKLARDKYPGQNILIIEDDFIFIGDSVTVRKRLYDFFNDEHYNTTWDGLLMGYHPHNLQVGAKRDGVGRILTAQATTGYLLRPEYISILLTLYKGAYNSYLETNKWTDDYCTDQVWKILHQTDTWYGFINPPLAKQRVGFSDIEQQVVDYGTTEAFKQRKKLTIVTAYINIPRSMKADKEDGKNSDDIYKKWMKSLLSYSGPMVIYTEKKYRDYIYGLRKGKQTLVILTTLDSLYMYRYKGKFNYKANPDMDKIMNKKKYDGDSLGMIWNEKVKFLKDAVEKDPFGTQCFAWMDIGSLRNGQILCPSWPDENRLKFLDKKITILGFFGNLKNESNTCCDAPYGKSVDLNHYKPPHNLLVIGGFIGCNKHNIHKLDQLFYKAFDELQQKGEFVGSDQFVMAKVCCENRDLFNVIKAKKHKFVKDDPWFYYIPFLSPSY